jgi:uncharacterized protein
METEQTRALIEQLIEAREAGDRDRIWELLADDVVWAAPAGAPISSYVGRDAVADAMAGGAAGRFLDVSTLVRTVEQLIAEGDTAAVRQHVHAMTHDGETYDNDYCWFYTCAVGKVTRAIEYQDTLTAARILKLPTVG